VVRAYRTLLAAALLASISACGHEVLVLSPEPTATEIAPQPLGLTVGVLPGSFDRTRLQPKGILDRFAEALRDQKLFQGVMYPVPAGVTTRWELELLAADEAFEPNSNIWKSALATLLLPAVFVIKLQNDYTLHLEALLLHDREVIGTYRGEGRIRHRYGVYANRRAVDLDGVETAVRVASRAVLTELARDLPRIESENLR
jgi:hypothetical protein